MLSQRVASEELRGEGPGRAAPHQYLETCLPPCRVMVVDDDALTRKSLQGLLQRERYEVVLASSGEEAINIIQTTPCDIVLTDWQMPGMNGLALCRRLRRMYQQGDVYVLLLTVRQAEQDHRAALAVGVDAYLVKGGPVKGILEQLNIHRTARLRRSMGRSEPDVGPPMIDPLTGAHDLRFFIEQLPREIERAQYSRHALALLSCSIDAFDQCVARYGTGTGNDALRSFVTAAHKCLRNDEGWIARVAENQFIIALRETRLRTAERVAQGLRRAFGAVALRADIDAGPRCFGVSIAVTAFQANHS